MPRQKLPSRRPQLTVPMFFSGREHHVSLGFYDLEERKPAEIFISALKDEGSLSAIARDAAVAASIGLQFGVPLWLLRDALNKVENEGSVPNPTPVGDAAGILGAALDAIREERPDLFEPFDIGASFYAHPEPGEPSFTLLGRDPQAPGLIELWADVRERLEPESAKVASARAIAEGMRSFKDQHPELGMARKTDDEGRTEILRLEAALSTLERLGYAWYGGSEWKPPLGKAPDYVLVSGENEFFPIYNHSLTTRLAQEFPSKEKEVSPEKRLRLKYYLENLKKSSFCKTFSYGTFISREMTREELIAENNTLHDQVAAQADELQELRDIYSSDYMKYSTFASMGSDVRKVLIPTCSRRDRQEYGLNLAHGIWGDAVLDLPERRRRMCEELYELMQASEIPDDERRAIEQEVFSRPPGELHQELGGASFTMLLFAQVNSLSLEECEVREINRVAAKDPNVLRARHAEKVAKGLAMAAREPDTVVEMTDLMGGNFGR